VTEDWRTAWVDALDRLELDVAATELMLDEQHRTAELPPAELWRPPTDLGTLPLELRPRADEILTRQLRAAEEIARRLTSNRQQSAMIARMETGEAVKRPLYLDRAM
jgi:hypothetical protein